tara:strand:+ start:355 stop:951 length:597 start_codon:yes stop_codon:yes gene_type:complete
MEERIKEILRDIPGKLDNKGTTSLKFKLELCEWMTENRDMCKTKTAVELGTCNGYTTRILSAFFKDVITFDQLPERISIAKQFNAGYENIEYHQQDIYNSSWWEVDRDVGLVFIDAAHEYEFVKKDFENSEKLPHNDQLFIVFDDYGAFTDVKRLVDQSIESGILKFDRFLGEAEGFVYRADKPALQDREGVMCIYER